MCSYTIIVLVTIQAFGYIHTYIRKYGCKGIGGGIGGGWWGAWPLLNLRFSIESIFAIENHLSLTMYIHKCPSPPTSLASV